jgi:hypothetical protein
MKLLFPNQTYPDIAPRCDKTKGAGGKKCRVKLGLSSALLQDGGQTSAFQWYCKTHGLRGPAQERNSAGEWVMLRVPETF